MTISWVSSPSTGPSAATRWCVRCPPPPRPAGPDLPPPPFPRFPIADDVSSLPVGPPGLGAQNLDMWRQLPEIVRQLEKDVKVIVLRGLGKHFCTGIDLDVLNTITTLDGECRHRLASFARLLAISRARLTPGLPISSPSSSSRREQGGGRPQVQGPRFDDAGEHHLSGEVHG